MTILDEHREPVPAGTKGELWIGGEAVARGYRGAEELSREKFRRIKDHGGKFYQTGDLVMEDETGVLGSLILELRR